MSHWKYKVKNHNIKLAANEPLANVAGSKYLQMVATYQNSIQEKLRPG
jgi:hypothetical protein